MTDSPSPFVPGARVARRDDFRFGQYDYIEDFVLKVHKSGNFTLKSDPRQQWRPSHHGNREWRARKTGDGWSRASLKIWDETTDAEIVEARAKAARSKRWYELRARIERIRGDDERLTDNTLDAIEAVLPRKEPP